MTLICFKRIQQFHKYLFVGGTRTEDARELIFARQSFVTHCKAFDLQAIDMVHINFKGIYELSYPYSKILILERKLKLFLSTDMLVVFLFYF